MAAGSREPWATPHTRLSAPLGPPESPSPLSLLLTGGEGQTRKPQVGGVTPTPDTQPQLPGWVGLKATTRSAAGKNSRQSHLPQEPRDSQTHVQEDSPPACIAESPRVACLENRGGPRGKSGHGFQGSAQVGSRDAQGHMGTVGTEPRESPTTMSRCLPPAPQLNSLSPFSTSGPGPALRYRSQVWRGQTCLCTSHPTAQAARSHRNGLHKL